MTFDFPSLKSYLSEESEAGGIAPAKAGAVGSQVSRKKMSLARRDRTLVRIQKEASLCDVLR